LVSDTGDGPSVLVVDAETPVLALLSSILRNNGFRALLARTPEEALEIASRQYVPIDLVLSNIAIGDGSGPDLTDKLRAIRPGVRVLYMSACVDSGAIRVQLMQQMDPGVYEPQGAESLPDAVRGTLRGTNHMRAGV